METIGRVCGIAFGGLGFRGLGFEDLGFRGINRFRAQGLYQGDYKGSIRV